MVRAASINSGVTACPVRRTAAAIRSNARSFGDTGALSGSAQTWSTRRMPASNCAAANAEWELRQNVQSLSAETYAAISSRSPRDREPGATSNASTSASIGPAVSGR